MWMSRCAFSLLTSVFTTLRLCTLAGKEGAGEEVGNVGGAGHLEELNDVAAVVGRSAGLGTAAGFRSTVRFDVCR